MFALSLLSACNFGETDVYVKSPYQEEEDSAPSSSANPPNAPRLSTVADTTIDEDTQAVLDFTLSDTDSVLDCSTSMSMISENPSLVPATQVVWSGTVPNCVATISPLAHAHGSSRLTLVASDGLYQDQSTFTLTVTHLGDDVLSSSWNFDALGEALYTFSTSLIQFSGGKAELIGTDHTDDTGDAPGFGGGQGQGVVYGTLEDGVSEGLKLGEAGGCDATTTNCSELSESWAPQWEHLIGYWKFNESSWIADAAQSIADSKGSHSATPRGNATTTDSAGEFKIGSHAASLDGASYIETNTAIDGQLSGGFSFSGWVRPTDLSATRSIFSNYNSQTGSADGVTLRFSAGAIHFFLNDSGGGNRRGRQMPSTSLQTDTWYHLGVTWDGSFASSAFKIYVNGVRSDHSDYEVGVVNSYDESNEPIAFGREVWGGGPDGFFIGQMDDFAFWDVELSPEEVELIYSRQSAKFSGTFVSRVMDALDSAPWTNFAWWTPRPYFKELPSISENSSSTEGYSGLVGSSGSVNDDDLMEGIVGLWHLDEEVTTAGATNDFLDFSGNANHGEMMGSMLLGLGGKFKKSVKALGSAGVIFTNYIRTKSIDLGATSQISAAGWFKNDQATVTRKQGFFYKGAVIFEVYIMPNSTVRAYISDSSGWHNFGTSAEAFDDWDQWHHIAFTYDGTYARVFRDGVQIIVSTPQLGSVPASLQPFYIGASGAGADPTIWAGHIDEVGLWNKTLHPSEIQQLYQRGASRLKHQVRSCASIDCAGEPWQGPDGTPATYFSELNNNTQALSGLGNVKATPPSMSLADFTSPPADKRYFQYRTIFEADDADLSLGPELRSVEVGPVHYPRLAPIVAKQGIAFYNLANFTELLGPGGCTSGVGYNLSRDRVHWKWWDGTAWSAANGSVAESNTAATVQAQAATYGAQVGRGTVYMKAYLQSSGSSPCKLDQVLLGGTQ